jgi:hypothetical protein
MSEGRFRTIERASKIGRLEREKRTAARVSRTAGCVVLRPPGVSTPDWFQRVYVISSLRWQVRSKTSRYGEVLVRSSPESNRNPGLYFTNRHAYRAAADGRLLELSHSASLGSRKLQCWSTAHGAPERIIPLSLCSHHPFPNLGGYFTEPPRIACLRNTQTNSPHLVMDSTARTLVRPTCRFCSAAIRSPAVARRILSTKSAVRAADPAASTSRNNSKKLKPLTQEQRDFLSSAVCIISHYHSGDRSPSDITLQCAPV